MSRAYGCVRCQHVHYEAFDDEYEAHIMWQSKHGTYEATPDEREMVARLRAMGAQVRKIERRPPPAPPEAP